LGRSVVGIFTNIQVLSGVKSPEVLMLRSVACLLGLFGSGWAQTAPVPRFEAASVKPSLAEAGSSGITTRRGTLKANNVTLKRCIIGAYGISPHQVVGGPAWLDSDQRRPTQTCSRSSTGRLLALK
jgi:hypothetical protein